MRSGILAVLILVTSVSWAKDRIPNAYDRDFKKWSETYLPFSPWYLLKAQCYQESLLNPKAVSPVGAKGLCQFMDFTWKDVSKPLNIPPHATAFLPDLSIQAAAYYDAQLRKMWKSPRPENPDRMNLVFASYNAGAGNIIKSQKACGGASLYKDIIACLESITGKHHKETKTYVVRIRRFEEQLFLEHF